MTKVGKVFLVGGGPGDPGLVTLRAVECLRQADLVLYDALIHHDLLGHCRAGAERTFVGKRADRAAARQQAINARLISAAREGKRVVRLKGGDPYLFGRGSEEAEVLAEARIPFEVVPGVPSPLAATAYAGISLSHREKASSIAYLTATEAPDKTHSAHDFSKLATATQTLVIFMGLRKLRELMQALITHGRAPDCPAAVIQRASLPEQRTVVGTVADIADRAEAAGLGMPALTVVGEVVELRERLRWYDAQPLFGKRVLVTREQDQAAALVKALRLGGASAIVHPAIRIGPPADPARLAQAVAGAGDYDWVAFTSGNAVDRFFAAAHALSRDVRCLGTARLAAVGPATVDRLHAHGLRPDAVPTAFHGEALAQTILSHHHGHMQGCSVLLPSADIARDTLPQRLRDAGAAVDVIEAYRTLPPDADQAAALSAAVRDRQVDVATFTSPSTVRNTVAAVGPDAGRRLSEITVASIGPVTTAAAMRLGIRVDITAEESTLAGLLTGMEQHFREDHR